jgi:hypothetical protein
MNRMASQMGIQGSILEREAQQLKERGQFKELLSIASI